MSLALDMNKIIEICRQHDVSWLGVFGSVARGDATEESDVDLLVRFTKPISLLSHIAVEDRLADALGRKVDLVTEDALSPYIRDQVMRDLKVIYEASV